MTTGTERDAAAVRVFPPAVPIITILVGALLDHFWPIDLGLQAHAYTALWIGGLIAAGSFAGLGLWSAVMLRRTGQSAHTSSPTTEIVERGPYRVTRNPMYLQLVLICAGVAVVAMNLWILLLTPLCLWVLHRFAVLPEEAYLERKFGETYLAYKRRVRRWI